MKTVLPFIVAIVATISLCNAQGFENTSGGDDQPMVYKSLKTDPAKGLAPLLRSGAATNSTREATLMPLLSGTYEVGDDQPVLKKLTDVALLLNTSEITGDLIYELNSTYDGTTGEIFPVVFNQLTMSGGSWTVTIRVKSGAGARTTSGNSPSPIITFDGADHIILDGREGGSGSSITWNIFNTSADGVAIGLMNDAQYNTIRYCDLAAMNPESGVVVFGSTTGTGGNDYNLIEYSNIHSVGANLTRHGIYCSNDNTSIDAYNSNNTVQGCNIYDYSTNNGDAGGIYLSSGSTAWTITGNSIYQSGPRTSSVEGWFTGIMVGYGDGYTITGNYIGGSSPMCGGSPMSFIDKNTFKSFISIVFNGTVSVVNPNSFQGNTITNIFLEASSSSNGAILFAGFLLWNGNHDIGNLAPNVLGSATATDAIKFDFGPGGTVQSNIFGIWNYRASGGSMMNNVVGGITITGNPAGTLFDVQYLTLGGTITGGYNMTGNLVGSLSNPASLQLNFTGTPSPVARIQAIYSTITSPNLNISNNTVANVSLASNTNGSLLCGIRSIFYESGAVVSSNVVRDLTCSAPQLTTAANPALSGINLNIPLGATISLNSIYNLKSTNGTSYVTLYGIGLAGTSPNTTTLERNLVHSLSVNTSSTTAGMFGIYCTAGMYTMKNNMIRLGLNSDGSSMSRGCRIFGIFENTITSPYITDRFYNNSIYIGGSATGGVTTANTSCFNSAIPQDARIIMNNIFWNARTGGLTGKHYAIQLTGTGVNPIGLISNSNLLYSTSGSTGYYNADRNTLADWQIATGQDLNSASADPNFQNPAGPVANPFNLHIQSPTPVETAGIAIGEVLDDFDGELRSGLTPTDIGADAGDFTSSGDIFAPAISYALLGNTIETIRVINDFATITDNISVAGGDSKPRLYFKRSTDDNVFAGNTSADNGWKYAVADNSSSPYSFTIDHSLLWSGGPATGITIQYFVAAQDITDNLVSNPAGASGAIAPPIQNISAAPPAPNTYYIPGYTISGTLTVGGAGANYANLTGTDCLFDAINKGVVTGNLIAYITGDLTEPGTVALNQFFEQPAGSNFTLTIVPADGNAKLISGNVAAGMIRFDGADRVTVNGNYDGSGQYLRFRNTSTSGPTFTFQNDATYNYITNSIIEGANTTTTSGVILFGTTTLNEGNDLNTFSGNMIRNRSDVAGVPYNLVYSAGINFHANSGNTFMNNEILNFSNFGINIIATGNGSGWTITGNSFYNNLATPPATPQNSIYINTNPVANGHVVSNNYIGGSAAYCGGLPWKNSGAVAFYGIYLSAGPGDVNYIQNNTIRNITQTHAGNAPFYGIYCLNGVFDVSGNTIGNSTGPASINTNGSVSFYPIYCATNSIYPSMIQNNVVSGISINSTTGTGSTYGIVSTGLNIVTDNTIGNTDAAGAITVANKGQIYGIYYVSPSIMVNNTVANILQTNETPGNCFGIWVSGSTAERRVEANAIMNIGPKSGPAVIGYVCGIYNNAYPTTITNNLISLGHGIENNALYEGIDEYFPQPQSTMSYYNNSIYIGGICTGDRNSFSYRRSYLGNCTHMDNIYANFRINGSTGTGKHCAYNFYDLTGVVSSDYNDLYTISGPLAIWGTTDVADLAEWQSLTGNDLNSKSTDPEYYSATDLRVCSWELDGTGIAVPAVTTDFTGAARGNPPDIGAYEFTLPVATITTSSPDEFCNGEWLTAHSSTTEGTFEWSTGETTQSIFLNIAEDPEGIYSVYVTDENGCRSAQAAEYYYQPQQLASSYTILGFEEAQVGENNTVMNGAVGLTGAGLTAHVKKNAQVNGPGSFVKAEYINAHPTAIIREMIYEPASVGLPTMYYNTTAGMFTNVTLPDNTTITIPDDYINLSVGKNCNVTLTGSIFGNIQVNKGSTLTFGSSSLDIVSLKSIAGSASSPVVIAFDDDATVRVKTSIDLDVYSTVNPEEKKVIFYIGIQDVPGGQLKVKATGAVFNGSVYAPLGQIQVITDGLPLNPAMMTGKFIANKVLATGKHVVWNWSDCSGQELQSLMNPLTEMPVSDKDEGDIALFLYPNPNDGQFKASITVPVEETFTCFVYNSMGQLIRVIPEIRSEGRIECFIDLRPVMQGIYTVIFQGKDHRMVKKIVVN